MKNSIYIIGFILILTSIMLVECWLVSAERMGEQDLTLKLSKEETNRTKILLNAINNTEKY